VNDGYALVDKQIKKEKTSELDDPFNAYRSIHFRTDNRTNEEKVKNKMTEAGHETRSVNQVVKLVNMSISEKVKKLEKLKQDSKRFDEELNMFTNGLNENPQSISHPAPTAQDFAESEVDTISKELVSLINKYGAKKLTIALDNILSNMKV
jgi:hypothetical protein